MASFGVDISLCALLGAAPRREEQDIDINKLVHYQSKKLYPFAPLHGRKLMIIASCRNFILENFYHILYHSFKK